MAFDDLTYLVKKQYSQWVKFRDIVKLSPSFGIDDEQIFLLKAREDLEGFFSLYSLFTLSGHISPSVDTVRFAAQAFNEAAHCITDPLSVGDTTPLKSAKQVFHLNSYWNSISVEFEALSTVWIILSKCIASEAANERAFSLEALIHNKVRNRLSQELVADLMNINWNYNLVNLQHQISEEFALGVEEVDLEDDN